MTFELFSQNKLLFAKCNNHSFTADISQTACRIVCEIPSSSDSPDNFFHNTQTFCMHYISSQLPQYRNSSCTKNMPVPVLSDKRRPFDHKNKNKPRSFQLSLDCVVSSSVSRHQILPPGLIFTHFPSTSSKCFLVSSTTLSLGKNRLMTSKCCCKLLIMTVICLFMRGVLNSSSLA